MKLGAAHNKAVLSCKTTPPAESQTSFLWGNFSPIASCTWRRRWTCSPLTSLKVPHGSTQPLGLHVLCKLMWAHFKSQQSNRGRSRFSKICFSLMLLSKSYYNTCQLQFIYLFNKTWCNCRGTIACHLSYPWCFTLWWKKTKTAGLNDLKDPSQIKVLQISLNRCWNQWPKA